MSNSSARSVRRRSLDAGRLARDRRRGGVLGRVWTSGRPDSGMEVPHGKAGTQEIRVSYALDGRGAPRSQCVGGPERASARGQRPHPLDVQRQAHQIPLAAHLRQAAQGVSSESEHFLDPPVRRLREPLALRVPGLAREATHPCGAWQGAGPGRPPPGTCLHAPALRARRCRGSPAPTDPARCSSPHRPVPPQARPQTSR